MQAGKKLSAFKSHLKFENPSAYSGEIISTDARDPSRA